MEKLRDRLIDRASVGFTGVLLLLVCLTVASYANDSLSIWVTLERGNYEAIFSVTGDAQVVTESTADGFREIAVELGYFPELSEDQVVKHESRARVSFWHDLADEHYRFDYMQESENYSLLSPGTPEVSAGSEALREKNHSCLFVDNHCTCFYPFQEHTVSNPEGEGLLFVRKAFRKEGPSSTALLEKEAAVSGVSVPYLFTAGHHARDGGVLLMGEFAEFIRDTINGILPYDEDSRYRLDQFEFAERSEVPSRVRYTFTIHPDDKPEFVFQEWVVDHNLPACVYYRAYGPDSGVHEEYVWDWEDFDGIAFPVHVMFRNYKQVDGQEVNYWRYEISLTNIKINEAIDEQKFSIGDIGLRQGDYIYDRTHDLTYPVMDL